VNYTEEQLYGSGILPPAPNTQVVDPFYDYAQSLYPQTVPTPNDTTVDSSGILPAPSPTPASVAPILAPNPTAPVAPSGLAPGEAVKVKEGEGVSVANSGLNFDTLGKLEKRDPIGKNVAKRMAPIDAELQAQSQIQNQNAAREAQTIQGYTDVDKAQAELQSKYAVEQSRLVDEHNNNVALAEEKGRQRIQSAMDQHERLKNEYLTMQVDPGMMWKNMTGGEKAGSGLAVFMSAFLGAKGIDTPVMGLLDKALDRNIDAQLQNIAQKGRALDAQGEFVQMVRQQSASDLEAKLRLKDAALESAKYAVSAEMSKFGSKLAELKGQELINNLNKDQLKFKQGLLQERTNIENTITGQEIQAQGDRLQAAQARAELAFRKDNEAYRRKQEEKANNPLELAAAESVFDTSQGANGERAWFFKPGLSEEEKKDTRAQFASSGEILSLLSEGAELATKVGPQYNAIGKGVLKTADGARLDQINTMLASTLANMHSGKQLTDNEYERYSKLIELDTWTNKEKYSNLVGGLQQIIKQKTDYMISQRLRDMPDSIRQQLIDSGYGPPKLPGRSVGDNRQGTGGFGADAIVEGNALVDDDKPEATRVATYLGRADEYHKNNLASSKVSEPVKNDWINRSTLFGLNKPDLLDYGVPSSFVELNNIYQIAKADGPESSVAREALATRANQIKSGLGREVINRYTKNLDETELYTSSALDAKYFLKKLEAEDKGSTFEREYLSPFASYKDVDSYHKDIK